MTFNETLVAFFIIALLGMISQPANSPHSGLRAQTFEARTSDTGTIVSEIDRRDLRFDPPPGVVTLRVRRGGFFRGGIVTPIQYRSGISVVIHLPQPADRIRINHPTERAALFTDQPLAAIALAELEQHFQSTTRTDFLEQNSLNFQQWRLYWPGLIAHTVLALMVTIVCYWMVLAARKVRIFLRAARCKRLQRYGPACPKCGYSYNGLVADHCPECGEAVQPKIALSQSQ